MERLQYLPKIHNLINSPIFNTSNKNIVKNIANKELIKLRNNPQNISNSKSKEEEKLINLINLKYEQITNGSIKKLINATGVVLMTNLGRSIFSQSLMDEITPFLTHFNNLEYDVNEGKRGERYAHIFMMLNALFNVEDSLIVNNNASAVLLILNTFAKDKEVIVSRGELVEIGGNFRIPEVMQIAGAILKEVGTTNKTNLRDYSNSINEKTAMIAKIHSSNYIIKGFTKEVEIKELSRLSREHNIIDYYDLGSGLISPLFNKNKEPNLLDIKDNMPSLISFSADKLLGGPQAGIILGNKDLIKRLKENNLLRALRVDKFSILALSATLKRYINNNINDIPTIFMLRQTKEEIKARVIKLLTQINSNLQIEPIDLDSLAGGGSMPDERLASYGISLFHPNISPLEMEKTLRQQGIISRILNNKVVLDFRTILMDEEEELINILNTCITI